MKTINLIVPRGWHELDDKQLRYVFGLLADDYTSAEIRTLCLVRFARLGGTSPKPKKSSFWSRFAPKVRWSGLQVIYRHNSDFVFRHGKDDFKLSATVVADIIHDLKWLDEIPSFPVRISRFGKFTALPSDLQSVPFEKFIYCDNLYQGYLHTKNDSLIDEMMKVLYPGWNSKGLPLERIATFYWFASLKQYFAKTFNHFFQQTDSTDGNLLGSAKSIGEQVTEAMNAQIRALTKGDITKEKEVLAMDCWRALTELNAQAKEYEELNRKYNTK